MRININQPTAKNVLYGLTQIRALRRTAEVAFIENDFGEKFKNAKAKNSRLEYLLKKHWDPSETVTWRDRSEIVPVSRDAIHFLKLLLADKNETERKELLASVYDAMENAENMARCANDSSLALSALFQVAQNILEPDYFPPPELPGRSEERVPPDVIKHLQNKLKVPHPLTGLSKETGVTTPAALIFTGWKCVDRHHTSDLKRGLFLLFSGEEEGATQGKKAAGFSYVFRENQRVWELSSATPEGNCLDLVQLGDNWREFGRSAELPRPYGGWEEELIKRALDYHQSISS